MFCPNCNLVNDAKNTFCTACGTVIPLVSAGSPDEAATVIRQPRETLPNRAMPATEIPATLIMSQPELRPADLSSDEAATVVRQPRETIQNRATPATEIAPTLIMPQPELHPTVAYVDPEKASPQTGIDPAAVSNAEGPLPPGRTYPAMKKGGGVSGPPTVPSANQRPTNPQVVPPNTVKIDLNVPTEAALAPRNETAKSKKSSRFLKIGAVLILLLLTGGGAAIYFLAQPMQSSRSYVLTNQNNFGSNVLEFDAKNNAFLMVGADMNKYQNWQITPDPGNKDVYRFVNRGIGENMSLEVIDDESDSSVTFNQTAKDVGQLWAITRVRDDLYRITNQWLGDTRSLSYAKQYFYFLRIRDSGSSDAQLWKKIPAPGGQGFYLVNKQHGEAMFLQALKDGDFKDKLLVVPGETGNRVWDMNDLGSGLYGLTTVADGKSLAVNTAQSDRVVMAASANSSGQRWKMIPESNGYFRLATELLGDGKSLEAVTFYQYSLKMVKTADDDQGQLWTLTRTD